MAGKKKWLVKEVAFIRAATFANLAMPVILALFVSYFTSATHEVDEGSVRYCRSHYTEREEYNPDSWLARGVPGKKGYLLGLFALGFQPAQIAQLIERQYPTHQWPGIRANPHQSITKSEAVEIAIATYDTHAVLYGKESLLEKYPNTENLIVQEVLSWNLGLPVPHLRNFTNPPNEEDDVVFILTRFGGLAPGFIYNLPPPQGVPNQMAPANQPYHGGFSSQYMM